MSSNAFATLKVYMGWLFPPICIFVIDYSRCSIVDGRKQSIFVLDENSKRVSKYTVDYYAQGACKLESNVPYLVSRYLMQKWTEAVP